jgi:hypothetical protein
MRPLIRSHSARRRSARPLYLAHACDCSRSTTKSGNTVGDDPGSQDDQAAFGVAGGELRSDQPISRPLLVAHFTQAEALFRGALSTKQAARDWAMDGLFSRHQGCGGQACREDRNSRPMMRNAPGCAACRSRRGEADRQPYLRRWRRSRPRLRDAVDRLNHGRQPHSSPSIKRDALMRHPPLVGGQAPRYQ